MKLRLRLLFLAMLALLGGWAQSAEQPPNVILIMVDDMGISDIGPYGGEIPTPHLDALAKGGLRFSQFYNTGRCCPTRASLLTGLYSHQAGIGWMTADQGAPGYRGRLNDQCVTIAEVLKPAGYLTTMTGKWHVGFTDTVNPPARGFDRSLNLEMGGVHFSNQSGRMKDRKLFLNGEEIPKDDPRLSPPWYGSDLWTDYGIKFIDEAVAEEKPFFLYLAHCAPHFPCMAPEETIAKYRGKFMKGWDQLREERYQRQIDLGLIDPSWPLTPRPDAIPAWDSLSEADQKRYDDMMAIYAAMIDEVDQNIGKLVAALTERGQLDNTLILFLSDNGGNAEAGVKGRYEGDQPGDPHSNVFVGQCWAHLNDTPFRKYKHYNHEGGIASPLIAHWPAGLNIDHLGNRTGMYTRKAKGGPINHEPTHLIDLMATCVDLSGADYPENFNGQAILPMEGTSLRPLFRGGSLPERPLFWEHEGNAAIRVGDRKLVREGSNGKWELYDLKADRTEQHDLAAANPGEVEALGIQWQAWAERAQVLPKPPSKGKKKKTPPKKQAKTADAFPAADPNPPQVTGRAFTIHANVRSPKPNGVVVSHGGVQFGYSLHFVEGKPAFSIRDKGALTELIAKEAVSGELAIQAKLDAETISISVNDKVVASRKSPGLFSGQPAIGLYVGQDFQDPVGNYKVPNKFSGEILNHKVDIRIPKVAMRTEWGEKVTAENVWQEYPRPQLRRDNWTNLNGLWDYAVTPKSQTEAPKNWDGRILVPFAIESPLSGVEKRFTPNDALWYRRTVEVAKKKGKRTLLNFEAVDYQSTVWVNDTEVGSNTGGNLPFSFNVTDALTSGENTILIRVTDATDSAYQLHGKQRLNPKGIWYTPVSGIWQTVWMEEVPELHLASLKIEADSKGKVSIRFTLPRDVRVTVSPKLEVTALLEGKEVASFSGRFQDLVEFTIPDPQPWSPDSPTLYDLKIKLGDDVIHSYFGLRETGIEKDADGHLRFTLNGKPIFHWGTLDQGWWPDGLLTPPSDEAMKSDIEFLKAAGFNTIRKHIKVEPRRYYYHCDKLGMMMWQDQVSAMADNPEWTRLKPDPATVTWPKNAHAQFMAELQQMMDTLHNQPCIVQWVPFNERWGQHQTIEVGKWTTEYDPTRQVNVASGGNWFPEGHIVDEHRYPHPGFPFELGESGRFDGYVKVMGEFGGHGFPVDGHVWDPNTRNWGYGGLPKDKAEWLERYRESIRMLAELKKQGIAAGIYTQTTDVEGEINGLITYDRQVQKVAPEELRKITGKLFE